MNFALMIYLILNTTERNQIPIDNSLVETINKLFFQKKLKLK